MYMWKLSPERIIIMKSRDTFKLIDKRYIYICPVLSKLNKSKKGWYIGNICTNAFVYADDIVLLSPSCTALKQLIIICEHFSNEYVVNLNPDKCLLLIFSKQSY